MNPIQKVKSNPEYVSWIFLGLIMLVYCLFPTHNSSLDSYAYAASMRWSLDIYHPHHLLYNFLGNLIYKGNAALNVHCEILALMKICNALAAVFCLFILGLILKKASISWQNRLLFQLLVAFSFGFWRFATENETYIFPILFSLLGSYFMLLFYAETKLKHLLLCGFFAAFACLWHQIHFFWWLGLWFGIAFRTKKIISVMLFSAPALLIPLIYYIVYQHISFDNSFEGFIYFIFRTYIDGSATTNIGLNNIVLTPLNLLRTIFQVHGNVLILISKHWLYFLSGMIALSLSVFSIFQAPIRLQKLNKIGNFEKMHLWIFVLQLSFAFFSVGNAEFMVMLPFVLIIGISRISIIRPKPLMILVFSLFLWNFTFAIFPSYFYKMYPTAKILNRYEQNPKAVFILYNRNEILNQLHYKKGILPIESIIKIPVNLKNEKTILQTIINQKLNENIPVFSNCIKPIQAFGRASFYNQRVLQSVFENYDTKIVDTLPTFAGDEYFYQIKFKQK